MEGWLSHLCCIKMILLASISVEKMQQILNIAKQFQKQNLLNFNLDKSERMIMNFRIKKI